MTGAFLPYGRQSLDQDDIEAVTRALRSDFLTTGPEVDAFEAEFAGSVNAPHAVSCNSATAGLHLALAGLGVGPGDICIVPAVTFLATANAARFCGADVAFADVDSATGLLTPGSFAEALERAGGRARAVLPVHLAGVMCDMNAITAIASKRGLSVVEDSCHALASIGANGQPAGACEQSDAAVFSFHPVKTLACGEGGMVTTRDGELTGRMRRLRSHGMERAPERFERAAGANEPWWYEMTELGWNYRMPDINAALGRSQLKKLLAFAARRRWLAARYEAALAPLAPIVLPPAAQAGCYPCRHLYNVRIDFEGAGAPRARVMESLKRRGVGSQVHYIPVNRQPYYRALYGGGKLPGAARYYERTLSLPLYPGMADSDPARVADALAEALDV